MYQIWMIQLIVLFLKWSQSLKKFMFWDFLFGEFQSDSSSFLKRPHIMIANETKNYSYT